MAAVVGTVAVVDIAVVVVVGIAAVVDIVDFVGMAAAVVVDLAHTAYTGLKIRNTFSYNTMF